MKILMAFYPAADPGGITNHNEQLVAGLQELGHEVHTKIFLPRSEMPRNGVAGGKGTASPYTGLQYDQRHGYSWPRAHCIPYAGTAIASARAEIKKYDLVIWQIAVPTKRKENKGNDDWPLLYSAGVVNLAVIHDGNFLNSYPWLHDVEEYITGLICVHHCAFNSARSISIPSAWIPNPQHITDRPSISMSDWQRREPGFLSLQTFKAWKHVPELVAAVPHMPPNMLKLLGGKGIDYYYMTSKDKCKYPGIWAAAIAGGMEYLDVLTNSQRDAWLRRVTCLVDPSWSTKYAKIGGHFNRVLVDAIICGTLPVARPLGISTNLEGHGELFVNGENCVTIPQNVTAAEYADHLTEICTMPYDKWKRIMHNAADLLPLFERKTVAAQVLSDQFPQWGRTTEQVKYDSDKAMIEFFGSRE